MNQYIFVDGNLYDLVIRRLYFILYTITSVGYGDSALPDLQNHHPDYTVLVGNILIGFFIYSIISANIHGFFRGKNIKTSIEISQAELKESLELFYIEFNSIKGVRKMRMELIERQKSLINTVNQYNYKKESESEFSQRLNPNIKDKL